MSTPELFATAKRGWAAWTQIISIDQNTLQKAKALFEARLNLESPSVPNAFLNTRSERTLVLQSTLQNVTYDYVVNRLARGAGDGDEKQSAVSSDDAEAKADDDDNGTAAPTVFNDEIDESVRARLFTMIAFCNSLRTDVTALTRDRKAYQRFLGWLYARICKMPGCIIKARCRESLNALIYAIWKQQNGNMDAVQKLIIFCLVAANNNPTFVADDDNDEAGASAMDRDTSTCEESDDDQARDESNVDRYTRAFVARQLSYFWYVARSEHRVTNTGFTSAHIVAVLGDVAGAAALPFTNDQLCTTNDAGEFPMSTALKNCLADPTPDRMLCFFILAARSGFGNSYEPVGAATGYAAAATAGALLDDTVEATQCDDYVGVQALKFDYDGVDEATLNKTLAIESAMSSILTASCIRRDFMLRAGYAMNAQTEICPDAEIATRLQKVGDILTNGEKQWFGALSKTVFDEKTRNRYRVLRQFALRYSCALVSDRFRHDHVPHARTALWTVGANRASIASSAAWRGDRFGGRGVDNGLVGSKLLYPGVFSTAANIYAYLLLAGRATYSDLCTTKTLLEKEMLVLEGHRQRNSVAPPLVARAKRPRTEKPRVGADLAADVTPEKPGSGDATAKKRKSES